MRTCSKTRKYSIAHNFLNNIGMLHLIMTVLMRGIQFNKKFWNMSYLVFTTTQNDEKLHVFDSNSLVILSIWIYHTWRDMYRWHECSWTQIVENCNKNMQQNSKIFNCSQLLYFDRNIGMLHLKMFILRRGIQLNKNFLKFELPSSHNFTKWWKIARFWFQFFSHTFYMDISHMKRHVQMTWM